MILKSSMRYARFNLMPQVWTAFRSSSSGFSSHIFNTILTTSKFPMAWKISKIVPIAKKNEPVTLSDYRPISILPALSKAMEVIVNRQINGYIENNGLLCRFQSGFRSNHSTCSALLKITNDLLIASEANCVSVMLLLEFSKAFDSVDHDLLCAKLADQYAFSRSAVSFIRSYLSQMMQCVWVNGHFSEYRRLHRAWCRVRCLDLCCFHCS
jgi:hypothetical protein